MNLYYTFIFGLIRYLISVLLTIVYVFIIGDSYLWLLIPSNIITALIVGYLGEKRFSKISGSITAYNASAFLRGAGIGISSMIIDSLASFVFFSESNLNIGLLIVVLCGLGAKIYDESGSKKSDST